jgi:hypothetical protein
MLSHMSLLHICSLSWKRLDRMQQTRFRIQNSSMLLLVKLKKDVGRRK